MTPVIAEVDFDENTVIDSNGEKSSISLYLNKVTPRKKDIQQYLQSFSVEMAADTTSENTENSQNCPDMVSLPESNSVSDLLYQNQHVEPDSTSEGKDDQPKEKKIKSTSEIYSGAMASGPAAESTSTDQYLQYIVPSDSQQTATVTESMPLIAPNLEKIVEKPFQCPFPGCSHRVAHKKNLFRHKKQKHGSATANGNRVVHKHVCNICGKKNLNYSNFKRHHETKHDGEPENYELKPFEVVDTLNEE